MHYEHSATIPASKTHVWNFLLDVPRVSQCVPGVHDVSQDSDTKYSGTLEVDIGIMSFALGGSFELEQPDEASGSLKMRAQATDRKIPGNISATMEMTLDELAPEEVRLNIVTEIDMLGRLGDFARPFVKKKADQMMAEFTDNVRQALS